MALDPPAACGWFIARAALAPHSVTLAQGGVYREHINQTC